MVIDSIMEALARQKVDLPVEEEVCRLYYSEGEFEEKLCEARKMRSQGIAVTLGRRQENE